MQYHKEQHVYPKNSTILHLFIPFFDSGQPLGFSFYSLHSFFFFCLFQAIIELDSYKPFQIRFFTRITTPFTLKKYHQYAYMHICRHVKVRGQFWELLLSFCHRFQGLNLCIKSLYLLSYRPTHWLFIISHHLEIPPFVYMLIYEDMVWSLASFINKVANHIHLQVLCRLKFCLHLGKC